MPITIAIVSLVIFTNVISVRQPRMAGEAILGVRPIAHTPVHKGDIHRYLEERIALAPGKEFAGYVALYLGADDGFVRKRYPIANGAMTHEIYVQARDMMSTRFGNMFQLTDLWNSGIPTLEDYGQWLTKQMFMFNSDLLARPGDVVDPTGVATHVYRFVPELLAKLGVRYIISDGTLNSPLVTEVARETGKEETTVRLYELQNANLGNLSPTKVVTAQATMTPFRICANFRMLDFAQFDLAASGPCVSASSAFDHHKRRISHHRGERRNLAPGPASAVLALLGARGGTGKQGRSVSGKHRTNRYIFSRKDRCRSAVRVRCNGFELS